MEENICDRLEKAAHQGMPAVTDAFSRQVCALLFEAASEIRKLRADVVVTRTMAGFHEIEQEIKDGPSV